MKAKNQSTISSEIDAKEKLIVYVYEYLSHSGAKRAAQAFLEDIQYEKEIQFNSIEGPGFLVNWWCVFWDLYCAAPEKRNQPEPSNEARAFHEYNMRSVMSPQISPPGGPPFMGGGQVPMSTPRYGPGPLAPPPHSGPMMRGSTGPPPMNVGPIQRIQGMRQSLPPPTHMGAPPPPHGPSVMSGAVSPRYVTHSSHITPGSSGPIGPEPGPSPGLTNRMTPNHSGSPHPHPGGPPPSGGMSSIGPPAQGQMPMSQGGVPTQQLQQIPGGGMPPHAGGNGWQGNQFNVNSPADQQCFMPGPPVSSGQSEFGGVMMLEGPNSGVPTNQQQEEYVMPGAYGPQGDQGDADIMKLKENLENNANESDQTAFNMDFAENQAKW